MLHMPLPGLKHPAVIHDLIEGPPLVSAYLSSSVSPFRPFSSLFIHLYRLFHPSGSIVFRYDVEASDGDRPSDWKDDALEYDITGLSTSLAHDVPPRSRLGQRFLSI